MGDGRLLEGLFPLASPGSGCSTSSWGSSTASLLGAGVKLWLEPLGAFFTLLLLARPLTGRTALFGLAFPLAVFCIEAFLKNPAIEVWFLELDVDFLSEGGGAGAPLGVFAEPAILRSYASK